MTQIPLIGYASRWSVAPGQRIEFKVSSSSAHPFQARLVRVVSADPNPEGPGIIEHPVAARFDGEYPSCTQPVALGSYLRAVPDPAARGVLAGLQSFTLAAFVWPTLPDQGLQSVMAWRSRDGATGCALAIGFRHAGPIVAHRKRDLRGICLQGD